MMGLHYLLNGNPPKDKEKGWFPFYWFPTVSRALLYPLHWGHFLPQNHSIEEQSLTSTDDMEQYMHTYYEERVKCLSKKEIARDF